MTDQQLVSGTLSGNTFYYDQLMQRYQELIYTIAYGFTRSPDDALDICQNAFLKAYQKLGSFEGKSTFKSWLARIAYHEAVDWSRRGKTHRQADNPETDDLPAIEKNADELISDEEDQIGLLNSLFRINERYRQAIILRYYNDFSLKEIARTLHCSEGVIKSMLHRGIRQLKDHITKSGF